MMIRSKIFNHTKNVKKHDMYYIFLSHNVRQLSIIKFYFHHIQNMLTISSGAYIDFPNLLIYTFLWLFFENLSVPMTITISKSIM